MVTAMPFCSRTKASARERRERPRAPTHDKVPSAHRHHLFAGSRSDYLSNTLNGTQSEPVRVPWLAEQCSSLETALETFQGCPIGHKLPVFVQLQATAMHEQRRGISVFGVWCHMVVLQRELSASVACPSEARRRGAIWWGSLQAYSMPTTGTAYQAPGDHFVGFCMTL